MSTKPLSPTLAYSYVRLSSAEQIKGHGKKRQLEQSAEYAKSHGLKLVDTHLDLGVSAFRGANVNRTGSALYGFLEKVRNGEIPKGSYLLIESLDRLSRQHPLKAFSVFLDIINAGINIHSLADGHTYRAGEEADPNQLWYSIASFSRGYDESLLKSGRNSKAWKAMRGLAETVNKPATARCPGWLEVVGKRSKYNEPYKKGECKYQVKKGPDGKGFDRIVKRIFEYTADDNFGAYVIAKRLNDDDVPTFGRGKEWQRAYITEILKKRAVLGECQFYEIVDGKRRPVGEPVKDHYPRIISDDLFNRAQRLVKRRRRTGAGRKGKYFSNLFTGIAICLYCHMDGRRSHMLLRDRQYLVCQVATRGAGCHVTKAWRYADFEASFLYEIERVGLPAIVNKGMSKTRPLDEKIEALEGSRDELERRRDILEQAMYADRKQHPDAEPLTFYTSRIREKHGQLTAVENQLKEVTAQRQALEAEDKAFNESKDTIIDLIQRLQAQNAEDAEDLYKLRAQVSARIHSLVDYILIAPAGNGPRMKLMLEWADRSITENTPESAAAKRGFLQGIKSGEHARSYHVEFKNGDTFTAWPDKDPFGELIGSWESWTSLVPETYEAVTKAVVNKPKAKKRKKMHSPAASP